MTKAELELNLKQLQCRFEDLEETITFNFANSSSHIGGGQVRKDMACLEELKSEISRVEKQLRMKPIEDPITGKEDQGDLSEK